MMTTMRIKIVHKGICSFAACACNTQTPVLCSLIRLQIHVLGRHTSTPLAVYVSPEGTISKIVDPIKSHS